MNFRKTIVTDQQDHVSEERILLDQKTLAGGRATVFSESLYRLFTEEP